MQNRIAKLTATPITIEELRPGLTLTNASQDRPFRVDMERFFDFTFSFAEALVDLEDRFGVKEAAVLQAEPEDWEIDVRWM